jgi:hypothetical protein
MLASQAQPRYKVSRRGRKDEKFVSDDVELDYNDLIQEAQKKAYRFLMRDVLTLVAELGHGGDFLPPGPSLGHAPGEHHFFIEFVTGATGVAIPDHLKAQYPDRMTIVLQHQFEELTVGDDQFGVTLWFKGKEARLEIPFDAVTQFADPSAQFGVSFDAGAAPQSDNDAEKTDPESPDKGGGDAPKPEDKKADGADIVSLDSFRKK